jgi:hypothetical protein
MAMRARLAGLDVAFEKFPDDVRIALEDAERFTSGLASDLQPADEPWPPMQVGKG